MSEVFVIKSIKPQKLNVDAFRLEILNALRKEGTVHKQKLRPTVEGWKNAPSFESLIGLTGSDATVLTGPTGNNDAVQHWVWTDQGTDAHIITAKDAPLLKFMVNYSPSTQPGSFSSTHSGSWPPWVSKRQVNHPGTRARNWTETLSKERKRPFTRAMFGAMKKAGSRAF